MLLLLSLSSKGFSGLNNVLALSSLYDVIGAPEFIRLVQVSVRIVPQYFRARLCGGGGVGGGRDRGCG